MEAGKEAVDNPARDDLDVAEGGERSRIVEIGADGGCHGSKLIGVFSAAPAEKCTRPRPQGAENCSRPALRAGLVAEPLQIRGVAAAENRIRPKAGREHFPAAEGRPRTL